MLVAIASSQEIREAFRARSAWPGFIVTFEAGDRKVTNHMEDGESSSTVETQAQAPEEGVSPNLSGSADDLPGLSEIGTGIPPGPTQEEVPPGSSDPTQEEVPPGSSDLKAQEGVLSALALASGGMSGEDNLGDVYARHLVNRRGEHVSWPEIGLLVTLMVKDGFEIPEKYSNIMHHIGGG